MSGAARPGRGVRLVVPRHERDTTAHRAINLAGWLFVVIGILGLIWRGGLIVWVFLIAFGLAALPRALMARRRGR